MIIHGCNVKIHFRVLFFHRVYALRRGDQE